jgi:hypothetical protein
MESSKTQQQQQEHMMPPEPQKEHKWLERLLGEWTSEADAMMGPDQPRQKFKSTEQVRSLGGLWIIAEGKGEMPGHGEALTMMTLGYNTKTKRFLGTFVGSMMTHLWVYDGELDVSERVLTLSAEGPDFSTEGKTAKYRDVIELKNDDHRTLTSYVLGDDGKWQEFMTANYWRKK